LNIIEQAAKRLEELQRSGVEVPRRGAGPAAETARAQPQDEHRRRGRDDPDAGLSSKSVEIDLDRLMSMGYLTPSNSRSQIANEFRIIKRPLLTNINGQLAAPIDRANLIMVTSSLPGEGKTFVSINLAMSIAMEVDCKVLLVDADVSRPAVLQRLGLPSTPGLLDLLTDPSLKMSDAMLRSNIERLTILPAGTAHAHATELLASDGMSNLLQEMASRYSDRVIVFDAPPLLASTESRVLATRMGQVILVVEADRTSQNTVSEAMATVEVCPVVLSVLNKTSRTDVGNYYYGSYGPLEG
jgi:exopolysaccharide/PEP-CTERM locus tyrosine autokinase